MSCIRRFFLGLVAAVVVASTFSALTPQANVSALSLSGTTSPSDLARAYLYGVWVKNCISKNINHNFDGAGINAGGWTSDGSDATGMVGVGSRACKEVADMTEAMKGVGVPWGSGKERIEALCKMGVTRHQPGGRSTPLPCYGPDPETGKDSIEVVADWKIEASVPDGFVRYVNAAAGGDIFSPSVLVKYFFYYDIVFKRQCDVSPDTGSVGATNVTTIPEIQSDGTFKDATYKYDGNAKINIPSGAIGTLGLGDGSGSQLACYKMGDKLRALSKDPAVAREWLTKYSPGHDGVPGTCEEYAKYHKLVGVDLGTICIEGFKNRSDPTYCAVNYPPGQTDSQITAMKPKSDACEYGAKVATAESGTTTIDASGDKAKDPKSTCGITGVGWIVCPVMTFLSEVMDNTFKFLADSFLSTDPEVFKIGSPTQKAWSIFLSYANVGFVIAFMIIIYSQITSAGISNYGIKKMLPKLIVSAILVNISYYLCQAAIDLSNVLGYSIMNLFNAIAKDPSIASSTAATLNWNGTITAILAGGAAIGLLVAVGGTFLLAALLAAATVVLILLARKALLILLVVLAPLAFVAYLLPNTSSLFTKWRKMFTSLLLVFPIVALLFGASKLAAAIISSSDPSNTVAQLMALAIAVIPLFAVVPLLKGAVNAIPVVGSKLQGWGNKATGRASAAGKKGLGDAYQNSTLGRYNKYKAGEKSKRNALIQAGVYNGRGGAFNPRNLRSKAVNKYNKSWVSGGFGDKTAASGAAAASKIEQEEVDNEVTKMGKSFSGPAQELKEATDNYNAALHAGDVVRARAAQKILLSKGSAGVQAIRDVVGGKIDPKTGATIYKGLGGVKNGAVSYARSDLASAGIKSKDAGLNTWSYDEQSRDLAAIDANAGTYTGLTDSELAGQSAAVLRAAVAAGHIDRARRDAMLANQTIEAQLSEDKKAVLR